MHFRRRMAKAISRKEAAKELGVSIRTIDRMRQSGELETIGDDNIVYTTNLLESDAEMIRVAVGRGYCGLQLD